MSKKPTNPTYTLPNSAVTAFDAGAEMPHEIEVERAVLGKFLIDCDQPSNEAKLQLTQEVFFDPTHSLIFAAIKEIDQEGKQTDLNTVGVRLKEQNRLRTVGGMAYLIELTQLAGSGVMLAQYVRVLIDRHISRQLLQASYSTLREILAGDVDIFDTINTLVARVEQAQLGALVGSNRRNLAEIGQQSLRIIASRVERFQSGQLAGIASGIKSLDRMTNGWQANQLIILAARPAMGKTAAMMHFALQAASLGRWVCVYSLEMTGESLYERALLTASDGKVSADNLRCGRLGEIEWQELKVAEERLTKLPIHIDDKSNVSMHYIGTHSRMMNKRGQCDIIFIDYLQLMDTRSEERGRNREQEVAQASKAAKVLAKELGVPVILLAQLNRANESRGSKEPMLSDLRESGAIEQDADMVIFPHRPEYYSENCRIEATLSNGTKRDIDSKGFGVFIVAKNRDGATGKAKFQYNESLTVLTDFDERPYLYPTIYSNRRPSEPVTTTQPSESFTSSGVVPF